MDRSRITPREFKGALKRVVRTPYVPQKVKDTLSASGANRFRWRSASKREFIGTMEDLREQRLIRAKRTGKQLYRDAMARRAAEVETGSAVPLASDKLPESMKARLFIHFYGRATGKPQDAKAILREMNLPYGSDAPPPGVMEPKLTKRQMLLVLNRLRATGRLTQPNIGKRIGQSFRRLGVFMQEGIEQELSELELKRYSAAAHEDLPEGVQRSIGRPAVGSALTAGRGPRTTSALRAKRDEATPADDEAHATTGSELARHPKPYDPKTSVTRSRGRAPGPPVDLPIGD